MDDLFNKPDKAERKQQIHMLLTFNQREQNRWKNYIKVLEKARLTLQEELANINTSENN